MTNALTMDDVTSVRGSDVYSQDNEKIGSVEEVYVDQRTQQPEWIGVGTGFLGAKRCLVPVQGATIQDDVVYVAFSKDHVKASPDIDEEQISQATEQEVYSHYGMQYSEARSDTGLPEGGAGTTGTAGKTVTRHEEELAVGKRAVDAGRLRLYKWVEEESVQADVEVKRETATVERESIDEPVSGAEMREEQIEVPLEAEEPVVGKKTVAKERLTPRKKTTTATEQVTDTVRKEQVGVDEDVDTTKR